MSCRKLLNPRTESQKKTEGGGRQSDPLDLQVYLKGCGSGNREDRGEGVAGREVKTVGV